LKLLLLALAVLVTAAISGAVGMGGGVALLAVMAVMLPEAAVVPVHGAVQLVSNSTRALRLLQRVRWGIFWRFVPLTWVGTFAAVQLWRGGTIPGFRPLIGALVLLFLFWERILPKRLLLPLWTFVPAGLVAGAMSVLVGVTGPFVAVFFLRDDLDREEIVATKASIQIVTHALKIPAFLSIGFDYGAHLDLILPLLGCAVLGTFLGVALLRRMGEDVFRVLFRVVLALLALRLLAYAFA
jgi:uncharacterized membrane protein YfcA